MGAVAREGLEGTRATLWVGGSQPAVSGHGLTHCPASVSVLSSPGTTECQKKKKKEAGGKLP